MGLRHAFFVLLLLGAFAQAAEESPRPHAYAFDQPSLLATQRVFGIGNAVTLLGEACADDAKASDSYAEWGEINQPVLEQMTTQLAAHYRIPEVSDDLQRRVAEAMHLKTHLSLSGSTLTEACTSLPQTLALPAMDLAKRYQAVLVEVQHPDYLKPKRPMSAPEPVEKTDDREEQTRSE